MEIFKKNKENEEFLDNLEVSKSAKTKSFVFGYLISLILVATPLIICAHFFIYSFYTDLILAILMFILLIFVLLGEILSDKILIHFSKTTEKRDLKITYLIHFGIYFVMMFLGYIIITLLI